MVVNTSHPGYPCRYSAQSNQEFLLVFANITHFLLPVVLVSSTVGCGNNNAISKWARDADVLCKEHERLLPLLVSIEEREDVYAHVETLKFWRKDYVTARKSLWRNLFDVMENQASFEQEMVDSFSARYEKTASKIDHEIERLIAMKETVDDREFDLAISSIIVCATTPHNTFVFWGNKGKEAE